MSRIQDARVSGLGDLRSAWEVGAWAGVQRTGVVTSPYDSFSASVAYQADVHDAQANGYRRFALGMAPLSDIDGRRSAPDWPRIAGLLFRHGEKLYGFRGLRAYKEKFQPLWAPRYIAGPRGLALVQGMRDLNALIGDPPVRPLSPAGAPPRG